MSPRGAIRALACGLALTALAAGAARAAPAPAAAELDAPHAVAAPFYGATLFDFYQDHPYAALTGLMVSQHFQRLAPQADEAEVLRGGLLLDYGMPQAAEAVFARLIDGHASAALRDRAWYFLARSQHERGADGQARQSLARIAAPLPGPLQAERLLLQAQLLMAGGDDAAAATLLDEVAADPQARPATLAYARFNLGVALLRQGEPQRGEAQLDALGRLPAADEELRSLRDRANLALGFAALQAGQPVQARAALQRVRLDGAASDKALLGYGWAAAQLHDPQLALTPWQTLAARPGSEAAVLEARIAVPYALSQLGAWGGALQGYRDAAGGFEREQQALAQAIAAVRAGALVQGLLQANPGLDGSELDRRGALATLPVLPALPPGQAQALVPLLAGHEFQQGLRNLRDLQFLGTRLARWQQSLDSFDDMLATRRRAYAERLPAVREQAGRADLAALAARLAALQAQAAEAGRAADAGDASAWATEREIALRQRIDRDRALVAQLEAGSPSADPGAAERLRRVSGALLWQQAVDRPARQWQVRKGLNQAQAALARAQAGDAALTLAQQQEPLRNQGFQARIQALGLRVAALQPQLAALAGEQQSALQDLAVAGLQGQQQRLDVYAAQARLAIAQILDRARLERRDPPPPAGVTADPAPPAQAPR